ncbi:MAG TPA: hypothetical protein VFT99_01300, partial [Roseiflexaceae bacterium]|nr:hypothetical protein [Roseiflexaceae bacterium]
GVERQRLRMEIMFLRRRDPGMKDFFAWDVDDVAYAEPARATDHHAIVAMVERFEGAQSAAIARHWLGRQPEQFLAYRTPGGALYGFMLQLLLQDASEEDGAIDPAVAAVRNFIRQRRPLAEGEAATFMRFWMGSDSYQNISPVVNITAANCVIHWTTTPGLTWSFVAMANPELMRPHFESIHFPRSPEADFVVGERRYGVFSHDWTVDSVESWRAYTRHAALLPPVNSVAAPVALEGDQLAAAVRQALRDATRLDLLATNPLLRSPILDDARRSPEHLQTLLREVVEQFKANPRDAKFYRAIWYTYIEPEPSQERVAERLVLPFNTYRYHLAKGIERVTAELARRAAVPT